MLDEMERPGWLQVGVAGELARKYGEDSRDFFASLATMLESALPQETQIERRGGWFAPKVLHRITVQMGDNRYCLESPERGGLRATRTHFVRGIALKTEDVAVGEWLNELGAALDERAQSSRATREALGKFVDF